MDKSIDITLLLYEKGSLPLKEIVSELDMPQSTCYNIVTTLENRGVLQKDAHTNRYSLGLTLMKLGFKVYNDIDIRRFSRLYLHKLVEEFNETATLAVFNRPSYESVIIDVVEGAQFLRTSPEIGDMYPLHKTGGGKCFLTNLSSEELAYYLEVYGSDLDEQGKKKLSADLLDVKREGFAVTVNELGNNAASVGAGIQNEAGEVVATITLSGPQERFVTRIAEIKETVKTYAREISAQLYGTSQGLIQN